MPHMILRHSKDLETSKLIEKLHHELCSVESISISQLKSHTYPAQTCIVGENTNGLFLNLTVKLLEGRTPTIKEEILTKMMNTLNHFTNEHDLKIALSVEISELSDMTYRTQNI